MCPNKDLAAEKKGKMSFELFKKIIDEAKDFVNDVYLHHRGEPLTNKDLFKMIIYAKNRGIAVRFHTNAGLLSLDKSELLIEAAPNLVSISFDGFTKDVYEKVRRGGNFETTVANIKELLKRKKQLREALPYIVIERIHFKDESMNVDTAETRALEQEFRDLGVNEIITKQEYDWAVESNKGGEILNGNVCTFPWYAMVICWDGTVTPCPQDFMACMNLGNVSKSSIKEIWNGAAYTTLRRNLAGNVNELSLCKKCDRLCRKQIGGIPFQYAITFLADQYLGYGALRKLVGTSERNG